MFFNKKASERSSADGRENEAAFLLFRHYRKVGNFLHNKKGTKSGKIISAVVAAVMLTGILTLLTGAVLDIKAKKVTLVLVDAFSDSEITQKLTTRQDTVSELLTENDIEIGEFDKISMLPDDELYDGARLIIRKGRKFTLSVDGTVEIVTTTKKTVREAFDEAGVSVNDADRVEPSLDETITDDMHVNVYRVLQQQITVDEEIPFTSKEVSDSSLKKGKTAIKTKGQNGLKRAVYNVTTENGIVVKRELVSRVTVRNPVTQIISVGTAEIAKKKAPEKSASSSKSAAKSSSDSSSAASSSESQKAVAASADSNALKYSKKLTVTATAYTAAAGRKTASGKTAQYGVIAVDPSVIPLGTRLYVESTDDGKSWSYGYCVAGDTGGAIKGNKIDLYYNSQSECVRFGRRTAIVYVLD